MMSDPTPSPPASAGLFNMALGAAFLAADVAFIGGALYVAPSTSATLSWAQYLATLGAGAIVGCVGFLLGLLGWCFLSEGLEEFRARWDAPARRWLRAVIEFLDDLRETDGESTPTKYKRHGGNAVDLNRLPPDIAAAVQPFLPPSTRHLNTAHLHELLAEATRLLQARERFTRQEKATIERQTELELSRARAAYVAGLSEGERAFYAARSADNRSDKP